jgi:tellurite resistance-related uncharacterized protein
MLGGVMSRPFVSTKQSAGVCAISSIESSKDYGETVFSKYMTFETVDHCLCVMEGALKVSLKGVGETIFREGETVVIPAGQAFSLGFESKYVKVHSFADGDGIESLIHQAGKQIEEVVLPDQAPEWDSSKLASVAEGLKITF